MNGLGDFFICLLWVTTWVHISVNENASNSGSQPNNDDSLAPPCWRLMLVMILFRQVQTSSKTDRVQCLLTHWYIDGESSLHLPFIVSQLHHWKNFKPKSHHRRFLIFAHHIDTGLSLHSDKEHIKIGETLAHLARRLPCVLSHFRLVATKHTIVSITWSKLTRCVPSPWRASWAAVRAFTAPMVFLSIQGIWTRPPTGSQVRLGIVEYGWVHADLGNSWKNKLWDNAENDKDTIPQVVFHSDLMLKPTKRKVRYHFRTAESPPHLSLSHLTMTHLRSILNLHNPTTHDRSQSCSRHTTCYSNLSLTPDLRRRYWCTTFV